MIYRLGLLAAVALSAVSAEAGASPVAAAASKPNLLVIQTDEHNFRTLGCYRAQMPREQAFVWGDGVAVETPHIDWLSQHGALADRGQCGNLRTLPLRLAQDGGPVHGRWQLPPDGRTLPSPRAGPSV